MSTVKDVARLISQRTSMNRAEAEGFSAAFFETIKEGLVADGQVKVKGLGTFKIQTMKQRESINVNTGERVIIDSHDRIVFTPDASMRDAVNKPFSHFETVVLNDGVEFEDINEEDNDDTVSTQPSSIEPIPAESTTPEPIQTEPTSEEPASEEPISVHGPVAEENPVEYSEPEGTDVTNDVIMPASNDANNLEEETKSSNEDTNVEQETEKETSVEMEHEKENVPVTPTEDNINSSTADDDEEEEDEEECKPTSTFLLKHIAYCLIIFIVGFFIGRYTSDLSICITSNSKSSEKVATEKVTKTTDTAKQAVAQPVAVKDTTAKKDAQPQQTSSEVAPATAENEKKDAATAKPQDNTAVDEYAKYDADPRIRTGAYRIIGVEKTIKVSKGQTAAQISRYYLGEGMDCYFEALNGKDLKAGQMVKIPKLKTKKALRKQNSVK